MSLASYAHTDENHICERYICITKAARREFSVRLQARRAAGTRVHIGMLARNVGVYVSLSVATCRGMRTCSGGWARNRSARGGAGARHDYVRTVATIQPGGDTMPPANIPDLQGTIAPGKDGSHGGAVVAHSRQGGLGLGRPPPSPPST